MSIPIQFKQLQLRNFLSFGNNITNIDLSYKGSILVIGENIDAGGANGCGKTTIINAICYALYNKPFDNISLQRLINATNNSKNTLMEARLFFNKGNDEYEIYRCRGETFNIQILMNGDDITLSGVAENDKLVEEIIGLSYELFTKVIIFSGNSIPFLMMPVSQQRQQIEELFNITILTEKAVKLKEVIKITENNISIQEAIIREQESAINLYNKQVKDAEQRVLKWEIDRKTQISELENQLQLIKDVDIELEKELHSFLDKLKKDEQELERKILSNKKEKNIFQHEIKKLINEIDHLIKDKCPYCLQKFEGAISKLDEKKMLLEEKESSLLKLENKIEEDNTLYNNCVNQLNEIKELKKFNSLSEIIKIESISQTAGIRIEELSKMDNPHNEAYEQLKIHAISKIDYGQLDLLKKDLEHQQFLLKLLTDKNSFIRRRIIQKTIPFLNSRLIYYTKELGLPHLIKFDNDMSCTVSEYGRELDFGNLSSGEKKRVNLSLSLAFRDVLHHLHAKINCLFIDEIDGSLDTSGVENVFKLLKLKTREDNLGTWLISHRPEAVGRFDKTIIIRKENGFSQFII